MSRGTFGRHAQRVTGLEAADGSRTATAEEPSNVVLGPERAELVQSDVAGRQPGQRLTAKVCSEMRTVHAGAADAPRLGRRPLSAGAQTDAVGVMAAFVKRDSAGSGVGCGGGLLPPPGLPGHWP